MQTELDTNAISEWLTKRMDALGIKGKELADLTDTSAAYISQLKNGQKSNPSRETLLKLAKGLESTPEEVSSLFAPPKGRSLMSSPQKPRVQISGLEDCIELDLSGVGITISRTAEAITIAIREGGDQTKICEEQGDSSSFHLPKVSRRAGTIEIVIPLHGQQS